jgi:hypothetical protein
VSAAKRIEGGTPQTYQGVRFDLPKGWQAVTQKDALILVPAGANAGGKIEELYVLASKPGLKALDGSEAEQVVEQAVGLFQTGLGRQGAPEKSTFGDLPGRVWRFTGKAGDRAVEARVYTFLGNALCGLVALGYPDLLDRRAADLKAVLGSLTKAAETTTPAGALAGKWVYLAQVNTYDGGRMTDSWLQLNADGTFSYYWEVSSSGPNGLAGNVQSDKGTWTATATSLTLKSASGAERTFQMEKCNHPKNKQDPMIVLDGRAYVTATPRAPW